MPIFRGYRFFFLDDVRRTIRYSRTEIDVTISSKLEFQRLTIRAIKIC